MSMIPSRQIVDDHLLEASGLKNLAGQIAEVLFDWGEINALEKKLDDTLLERVSRVLRRMEENPSQRSEAEQILVNITEPELAVALLQQFFLIHQDFVAESVTKLLMRLAQSQNKKTAKWTMEALKEAANSEIPRLQGLGCRGLYGSDRLSAAELLVFARSEMIDFTYRIEAAQHLLDKQEPQGLDAFLDLLRDWDALSEAQKNRFRNELFKLARRFEQYQGADHAFLNKLVDRLYNAANGSVYEKGTKKIIQQAMAVLPNATLEYLQELDNGERTSPTTIFTLGACAKRTPLATQALIELGAEIVDEDGRPKPLIWIAQQLDHAANDGCLPKLEELIQEIDEYYDPDERFVQKAKILEKFHAVQQHWESGKPGVSLQDLLAEMEEEYDDWPDLDENQAKQVRFLCEKEYRSLVFSKMKPVHQAILVEAMRQTAQNNPWYNSAPGLRKSYASFSEEGRLVVLDVLGIVALSNKGVTENKIFRETKQFFERLSKEGSEAERDTAMKWLFRLGDEVLPDH